MALYLVESLFGSLIAHANRKSTDSVLSVCNYWAFCKLVSLREIL